jgi:predicted N-formylglutamate amidohydrolase
VIGDNEPYSGKLKGDCLYQHGTKRALAHGLLEIRQDLISDEAGIDQWVDRLVRVLPEIMSEVAGLNRIEHFSSHTD